MNLLSKIFGRNRLEMQDISDQNDEKTCDPQMSKEECAQEGLEKGSSDENVSPFLVEDKKE